MLPAAFETPIFWSEEQLAELKGSSVYSVTKKRNQSLAEDYANLFGILSVDFPELFPADLYTQAAYIWAISTVWSRSFIFNVEGSMVPVFVPFADMLGALLLPCFIMFALCLLLDG